MNKIGWTGSNSYSDDNVNPGPRLDGKQRHHPVKTRVLPNAWGLYDMAGNVWEWTHGTYEADPGGEGWVVDPVGGGSEAKAVLKGSCYGWDTPMHARAAARRIEEQRHLCKSVGFRLARTLQRGPLWSQ